MIGIYCFYKEDKPVYVGASIDIERRRRQHINAGRFHDCEFKVLEETTAAEMYNRERYYITEWNMCQVGENKVIHNNMDLPEVRARNSKRMKGNNPMKPGMTNRGSYKKGRKGRVWTEEEKEKASNSKKGTKNPNYGKPEAADRLNTYLTCEVCGTIMNRGNFIRWGHGPECTRKSNT